MYNVDIFGLRKTGELVNICTNFFCVCAKKNIYVGHWLKI